MFNSGNQVSTFNDNLTVKIQSEDPALVTNAKKHQRSQGGHPPVGGAVFHLLTAQKSATTTTPTSSAASQCPLKCKTKDRTLTSFGRKSLKITFQWGKRFYILKGGGSYLALK